MPRARADGLELVNGKPDEATAARTDNQDSRAGNQYLAMEPLSQLGESLGVGQARLAAHCASTASSRNATSRAGMPEFRGAARSSAGIRQNSPPPTTASRESVAAWPRTRCRYASARAKRSVTHLATRLRVLARRARARGITEQLCTGPLLMTRFAIGRTEMQHPEGHRECCHDGANSAAQPARRTSQYRTTVASATVMHISECAASAGRPIRSCHRARCGRTSSRHRSDW